MIGPAIEIDGIGSREGREPLSNIIMRTQEQGEKVAKDWRAKHADLKNKLVAGWYVKAHFQECVCRSESMWVFLKSADDGMLYGRLDNDPAIVDMKCGDMVTTCWDDLEGAIDPAGKMYS